MINEKKLRLAEKVKLDKKEEQAQENQRIAELESRYDHQIETIKTSIENLADALQVSVDFPDIQPLLSKLLTLEQLPDTFADIKNMSLAISNKLEKINGHFEKKQVISVRGFAEANVRFENIDKNIEKFADLQTYLEQLTDTLKQGQDPTDFRPVRLVVGGDGVPLRYLADMPSSRGGGGGGSSNGLTDEQLRASPVPVSGTVTTSAPAAPTTLVTFVQTIDTAGTEEQLPDNTISAGILQAPSTNTGVVYIGNDNTVSSTNFGAELQPGQSSGIAISNTNKIWVDVSVSGDKVAFMGS